MRLLLLITDLEIGGTPTVVRELATRLASPDVHVEVACLKPMGPVGYQLRERGIRVTSFETQRLTDLSRTTADLIGLVRSGEFDTVFSFLIHANFVAFRASRRLPGVRFLQSIQTTQPRPRWHWWLQRRVHRAAERIVVPSASVARCAVNRSRVPSEKLVVVPNAVDVESFTAVERTRSSWPRVGFVGRLDPVKRIGDLLSAMTRLSAETTLDVYGEGVERRVIEHTIASTPTLAGRVILHGAIADPRKAYEQMDVLVLPSEAEGFGLVLIEAMAAGVPIVATNVDGIRDVVRDGQTGLLVPPGDPAALADAIGRVLNETALRESLVEAAWRDVEVRFSWPAVIRQYQDVLNTVAAAET